MPSSSSNIMPSVIDSLFRRVRTRNYRKYLVSMRLSKLRRFQNQYIQFDFPVTAIIGVNGGGKTTILGAAACAYISSTPPRQFFRKASVGDDSMSGWEINYKIVDQDVQSGELIDKKARFRQVRWRRDGIARDVSFFGVMRTVPAGEWDYQERNEMSISDFQMISGNVASACATILGRDVSQYKYNDLNNDGTEQFFIGKNNYEEYSELHFWGR